MAKTVLVVDDSMYMRSMISDTLTSEGYMVVGEAHDGESAIDLAIELKPDLITLDNILPDMIGIDVLKVLKEEENISSKIIMVSAVGQESVIQEGLSIGASDYIVKPFTSERILTAVNNIME